MSLNRLKGVQMDADSFLKQNAPRPRSAMADYWDDIKKLRAAGCTLEQVREFLAANGVTVSVAAISKYIKRREAEGETIDKGETRTTAEKIVERQKEAAAEPASSTTEKSAVPGKFEKKQSKTFGHSALSDGIEDLLK